MPSQRNTFLYSRTALSLVIRVFGVAVMFAAMIALSRALSPDQFGLYAYAVELVALAAVFVGLGINQIAVRVVSDASHAGDAATLRRFCGVGVVFTGLSCTLVWLVLLIADSWQLLPTALDRQGVALIVGLLFAASLLRLAQEMMRGAKRIFLSQAPEQLVWPTLLLVTGVLGTVGVISISFPVIAAVHQFALLSLALVLLALFFKGFSGTERLPRRDGKGLRSDIRAWLMIGLPLAGVGALSVFLKRGDMLFLGAEVSAEQLAPYAAAVRIAGLLIFALAAANSVTEPLMREAWTQAPREAMQSLTDRSAALATLIALPAVAIILVAPDLLLGLFGPAYTEGAAALRILAIGQFAKAVIGPVGPTMIASGSQTTYLRFIFGGAAFCVIALSLLVPTYGLEGAATATALSGIVTSGAISFWIWRRLNLRTVATTAFLKLALTEIATIARKLGSKS